jgi:predicted amidophosphoribosyltransferase
MLFPARCPGCGVHAEPVCASCAVRIPAPRLAAPPPGVAAWFAPFAYTGTARELVARVKYRHARAAVPWLAAAMVSSLGPTAVDLVTWAPTTAARRRDRGFDHAELLARRVGHLLNLQASGLLRRIGGQPQTGLPSAARRVGPQFTARRPIGPYCVMLVDDVATTGATLGAAASALRAAGAKRVIALTAARTPSRSDEASVSSRQTSAARRH